MLTSIGAAAASTPTPAALRGIVPPATLIGLFRDLRGIASATSTRRTYCLLFDWLYPQHMPVVVRCLEAYAGAMLFSPCVCVRARTRVLVHVCWCAG